MKTLIATKLAFRSKVILFCYQTIMIDYVESTYNVQNTQYPQTHNNIKCDASQVAFKILSINRYFWTPY